MKKQAFLLLMAATLCGLGAACGGDVCEEAYEKQQDCVAALNCKTMDLTRRDACELSKKRYSIDYTLYKANQEANGIDMACEGDNKSRADGIVACTLAPQSLCETCQ